MTNELITAIRKSDIHKVIELMITSYNGYCVFGVYPIANTVDFSQDAINEEGLTVRTHKFLETMCEFDNFTRIVNNMLNNGLVEDEIVEKLQKKSDNIKLLDTQNTYNWETDLENDLQYALLKNGYEYYVILRVHCGGDIRGCYSEDVCFKLTDIDYFAGGMSVEAYEEGQENPDDFVGSYQIEENCEFDKESKTWFSKSTHIPMRFWSLANGF